MEGRKLLEAHVFNGRQEIVKPTVAIIAFPWIFEIFFHFTLLYTIGIKKHILFNKFLSQKNSHFDREKEMGVMKEERPAKWRVTVSGKLRFMTSYLES